MPRLNHGGMEAMDGDGLTTQAITGTERGPLTLSQPQRPMPKPSLGGTEAMDGDGLTTLAITGTERGPLTLSQPQRLMPRPSLGGMKLWMGMASLRWLSLV